MKNPKKSPEKSLGERIRAGLSGATRVAVLGVGSELLGDDAAGMLVAGELDRFIPSKGSPALKVLMGSTAPENFTGEIKKFEPSHLIIVDCADMGKEPGETVFLEPESITGISFSTHRMPVTVMMRYLRLFVKCELMVIGIQPKTLRFGESPSAEVRRSAKELSRLISETLGASPARGLNG